MDIGTRPGDLAIDVRGLRKAYGSVEAVRGVDLQVAQGEAFALLGPNGAGKTTTVEILEGHRDRSDGHVSVLGHDPADNERAFRERIGIVLQTTSVDRYLSVTETINLFRGYYPAPLPLDEILGATGLADQGKMRVGKLSGGQQRRLDVAIGLSGNPELLFLDEPTTGFDPSARRDAWEMIKNLKTLGKTVLLTTHYMEEAEYLADRVAIMVDGQIVIHGAPSDIASRNSRTTIRFTVPAECGPLPDDLEAREDGGAGNYVLETDTPAQSLHRVTTWLTGLGQDFQHISVARRSLEDLFLELTGDHQEPGERTQ